MPTITLLDDNYASLVYHQEQKIVHHCFHKALDSQHLRTVLNQGVDLLTQHGASKWLSDNREIDPHSDEDGRWVNDNWLPRAVAAGWKYWALVVPEEVAARLNMTEFVNSFFERGIRIMVFSEPTNAMKWLEGVDRR
jgi:hypothetical protein